MIVLILNQLVQNIRCRLAPSWKSQNTCHNPSCIKNMLVVTRGQHFENLQAPRLVVHHQKSYWNDSRESNIAVYIGSSQGQELLEGLQIASSTKSQPHHIYRCLPQNVIFVLNQLLVVLLNVAVVEQGH